MVARYTVPLVDTIENVADVFTSFGQLYSCRIGVTGGGGDGSGDCFVSVGCGGSLPAKPLLATLENVADVFTSFGQLYSCTTGVTGGGGGGGGSGDCFV
jgi:hypothetical protein